MSERKFPIRNELEFNKFLVSEYLRFGSVDEVFKIHKFDLPVSYANYQRVLNKWNVIKAAGPHSELAEAIDFLTRLIEEKIPLEELYKKMPPSFQTSASTMHRILSYVKVGLTRRVGTALIITPYKSQDLILVAQDVSTPRVDLGKPFGSFTIPMGFSRKRDTRKINVIRILQQEVFAKETIEGRFPLKILPEPLEPFMYLDVADIRVSVYHIPLPSHLNKVRFFSSFKLRNYEFTDTKRIVDQIANVNFRTGITAAVSGYRVYKEFKEKNMSPNPIQEKSLLNRELALLKSFYHQN